MQPKSEIWCFYDKNFGVQRVNGQTDGRTDGHTESWKQRDLLYPDVTGLESPADFTGSLRSNKHNAELWRNALGTKYTEYT